MNRLNGYTLLLTFIVSIGGLLLGISANVSGASEFYRSYFDLKVGSFLEGFGVSIAMLATFIGNFNAGTISDKIGRKKALLLAAFLFSFCTLGSGLATNYTFFLISRFIGGLGIGISLLVVPMFIAEFAPSGKRGFLVSFNQLNIGIGFLLAYVINSLTIKYIPDPDLTWRWMLGIGFVFPAVYFIALFFVPESPRWLINRGKDEEAKKVMRKIGGEEYAETEYQQIKQAINFSGEGENKTAYGELWGELFSKPMRLVLLIAFSVAFFQMASGFNSVMFFVPRIFRLAGFGGTGSFFMSNLVGIAMVVMTVVSMFLIDRLGRKPLLLIGVSLMLVSLMVSAWSFSESTYTIEKDDVEQIVQNAETNEVAGVLSKALSKSKNIVFKNELTFFHQFKSDIHSEVDRIGNGDKEYADYIYSKYRGNLVDAAISINSLVVMIAILCFVVGFAISLGPVTWALLSEVFPGKLRGLGISIAGTLNGLTSFIVTTIFPIELEYLGSGTTFFIYGILMFVFILMVIKWFPETKGKTLEEIEAELVKN